MADAAADAYASCKKSEDKTPSVKNVQHVPESTSNDRCSTVDAELEQFRIPTIVGTTPSLRDLCRYVTPIYATEWREIGIELGLPNAKLKEIYVDSKNVKQCCNDMLAEWLCVDTEASWKKIFSAIDSPATSNPESNSSNGISKLKMLSITTKGDAVTALSARVSSLNIQARLRVDNDSWPPHKPKTFTPLVLVRHQSQFNLEQAVAMTTYVQLGHIDELITVNDSPSLHPKLESCKALREVLNKSIITKEIGELLAPLQVGSDPQFVLIEGAPGIGKSLLLQEIAYRWGKRNLLQEFKLVLLLCLRDPAVQQMSLVDHLFELFCKRDRKASDIAASCSEYFLSNSGQDLVFLIDGYDEFPENLREVGLIADILNRQILPLCGLVVSSRPHASVTLRQQASITVDILGFTEQERQHYIQQTLQGEPEKIVILTQYLNRHLTISSLCYVPFNMVVLLHLLKQGIPLPQNSTELYQQFICLTICQHLARSGYALKNTITDLTNLPEPCIGIIKQLSLLSLDALNQNKLIFTLDEIKAWCKDFESIPGALNGFGLLQVIQHIGLTGTTSTFNFVHLSIQEFLAAYGVAYLQPNEYEQQLIIEKYFWNGFHFNMFTFYVALTKGQQPTFKQFLSGGSEKIIISKTFLGDLLKCIRLYHCFHEAGDRQICANIAQAEVFDHKMLNFTNAALSASEVESIAYFLTSSFCKEWQTLDFIFCFIQDHGLHILYRALSIGDIFITELVLCFNYLTVSSSSFISDIVIKCRVKKLSINGNKGIGEDEQLYTMLLHPDSLLEELSMYFTGLSSNAAIKLFTALRRNSKLKGLSVSNNKITDSACDAIAMAMSNNTTLVSLRIWDNPVSAKAILSIMQALQFNDTLELLRLPQCPEDIKKSIMTLQTAINSRRKQQYHVDLRLQYSFPTVNS